MRGTPWCNKLFGFACFAAHLDIGIDFDFECRVQGSLCGSFENCKVPLAVGETTSYEKTSSLSLDDWNSTFKFISKTYHAIKDLAS